MNSLSILLAGSALIGLTACATQAPERETQSILEVLDEAQSAAPASSERKLVCGANEVNYCEVDLGAKHCACKDAGEVNRWLGRMYGSR